MRKLLPSLLIAIMALSVLSCAGVVSATTHTQATTTVHPLVIGPSTPQYYPVTAAPGKNYYFYPGDYNYYGTSLTRTLPGVVQATANPNNGNLYAYESTKAYYAYEYAEAVNGVNLQVNAPTAGPTATTATITVYEKAAFQTQVSNPFYAWGEMGTYSTYNFMGSTYSYDSWYSTTVGKQTTNQAMTTAYTINPAGPLFYGWFTGEMYQVAGYVNAQSLGHTTGTVNAQGQVQSIELQFS